MGHGAGSGLEQQNKESRTLEVVGEDDESTEQLQSEQPSTKRDADEALSPVASTSPNPTSTSPNPASTSPNPGALSSPPSVTDQHHFLRSSVRPPSKRLRRDCIEPSLNGHSSSRIKGQYSTVHPKTSTASYYQVESIVFVDLVLQ